MKVRKSPRLEQRETTASGLVGREWIGEMNPIGELLRVDDIHLDLDVSDKGRLLERIAVAACATPRPFGCAGSGEPDAREQLGSTGLGHGVAIPHARMPQCYAAAGVFVRTKAAVPFDAPDRKPVSIFLALIVPKAGNRTPFAASRYCREHVQRQILS